MNLPTKPGANARFFILLTRLIVGSTDSRADKEESEMEHFILVDRSTQHAYCPWQYSAYLFFRDGTQKQIASAIDMYSSNFKRVKKRIANRYPELPVYFVWEV